MDPNMNQQYAFAKMGGMDPNMVGVGMQNGMRPPSSHPGQGFQGQNMTPQQVVLARGMQQQQAQAAQQAGWQGPNGQMGQPPQGAPQPQNMGTPQQRAMPPPSAPQAGPAVNGRTPSSPQQGAAPPTPQQGNKAIPKGKKADPKDTKAKVYSRCVNGYYCRNVDIDISVRQRKDPLQISTLVLHHPPIPTPRALHQLLKRLSRLSTTSTRVKGALFSRLRMVSRLHPLETYLRSTTCSRPILE